METLVIDVLSPPFIVFSDKNSETFFTLLGLIEKAKKWLSILLIDHLLTLS